MQTSLHKQMTNSVSALLIAMVAVLSLGQNTASGQTVDVGPPDTSVCNGQPITLTAVTTGVSGNPTFTSLDLNSDDTHSQVIDIGFDFEFFGNTYDQLVASSNGYVTFDLTQANNFSPWNIGGPSPTPGVPDNAIMFPWQDINPASGSNGTDAADCGDGTFIVDYVDIAMFSCTELNFTMQVVLYEGSNIIDTYISEKPLCTTWNGGAAIHGLENANGTQSVIVPGRNAPTQWTATNDAVRFTPDGFGSYTIDQTIPFNPIPVGSEVIEWTDGNGNIVGDTESITVTPSQPTWYFCTYKSACSAITVSDSILVTLGNVDATATPTDVRCFNNDDGFVEVDPTGSAFPVSLTLEDDSGNVVQQVTGVNGVDTLAGLAAGDYTVVITDGVGCATDIDFTIAQPTLLEANAAGIDILCNGDDNGRAYAAPTGGVIPYELQWNDPLQQTTDTIEFLPAGAYTVTVTDANNCVTDTTIPIEEPLPLIIDISSGADTCLNSNGAILTQMQGGTPPFTYTWNAISDSINFEVDSVNYTNLLTGLPHGDYEVMVTDSNDCEISGEVSVALIAPPMASFLTRSEPEEVIDPEVQFVNESSNAVTYQWNFGDGFTSSEFEPLHSYDTSGVYLVMLVAENEPRYGCADTAFNYVDVEPLLTFYVPNAFTPDDDGLNDVWKPKGQNFEYESYNVKIFDRWGKLVWQTDNPEKGWDGTDYKTLKDVKQGVYIYVFTMKKFNTFEPKVIDGHVTLYRHNRN